MIALFVYAYLWACSATAVEIVVAEDSHLTKFERQTSVNAGDFLKHVFDLLPSYSNHDLRALVVFARSDSPPIVKVFNGPQSRIARELVDSDGVHSLYLFWDLILRRAHSPLLLATEEVADFVQRALDHRSAPSRTAEAEALSGWTGSMIVLNELKDAEQTFNLPDYLRRDIRTHLEIWADKAPKGAAQNPQCLKALTGRVLN